MKSVEPRGFPVFARFPGSLTGRFSLLAEPAIGPVPGQTG